MTEIFSLAFGIMLMLGILFFVGALLFEAVCRLRDRFFTPEMQLYRADLGRYPHWQR
jgi:hypothetical protein